MSSVFSRPPVNRLFALGILTLGAVLVGCNQAPVASTGTPAPSAIATASSSAAGVFTSARYHYSITLPIGWVATPALETWDGTGAPAIDDPAMDVFGGSAFGAAAPTTSSLAKWVADGIAISYQEHSNTCPEKPGMVEAVSIGGQPGTLVGWNCGILINTAYAVVNGYGYRFGFRDVSVAAATDPTDKATFTAMLASIAFH